MDTHNTWKKTEDREIDFTDLLYRFCMGWKQAAACALIFAVLLGGYGFFKGRAYQELEKNPAIEEELTEEEQQGVAAAVKLEAEARALKEYLDNSILMQIDPYHKDTCVMLYSIQDAKLQDLQGIVESYLSFFANGGVVGELDKTASEEWDMDSGYLPELITAYQRPYSAPYQMVVDGASGNNTLAYTVFYVETSGKDGKMAQRLAECVQAALEKYFMEAKDVAGSHKLELLSKYQSVRADGSLQVQQHDKRALLDSDFVSLKAMTDAFSKGQEAAYEEAAGIQAKEEETGTVDAGNQGFNMKYILLGLAGGVFVYGCAFVCLYIFRDTVKSVREMKGIYAFPVYGCIDSGKDVFHKKDDGGSGKERLAMRLRAACMQRGITELCVASDYNFSDKEKAFIRGLSGRLQSDGIEVAIAENACKDAAAWEKLAGSRHILMACRAGETTYKAVDGAVEFYVESGMDVVGAVLFGR